MADNIENVITVIEYIEDHLAGSLDLNKVAGAMHYSKYHLHRMFVKEVGMTIHEYVQRRQLTEAARLLVFTDKSIMEIALIAGYESRQAFTTVFKEMYKKTPNRYRQDGEFYPLQLRYILHHNPGKTEDAASWQQRIVPAVTEDIPLWIDLVHLVIDGFPYLDEEKYIVRLQNYIAHKRAFLLKDSDIAVGAMAFQGQTGSIDFLGIHPQYRKQGIAEAFMRKALDELVNADTGITVTTFREGDKADTGYRDMFKRLGFTEAELLVEFGYPTQRLVLRGFDK